MRIQAIHADDVAAALQLLGIKDHRILGNTYTITVDDELYGDPYVVDLEVKVARIEPDGSVLEVDDLELDPPYVQELEPEDEVINRAIARDENSWLANM